MSRSVTARGCGYGSFLRAAHAKIALRCALCVVVMARGGRTRMSAYDETYFDSIHDDQLAAGRSVGELVERIREIEQRAQPCGIGDDRNRQRIKRSLIIPTGWSEVDRVLVPMELENNASNRSAEHSINLAGKVNGGLQRGAIHEFLGLANPESQDTPHGDHNKKDSHHQYPHHHNRTGARRRQFPSVRWTPAMSIIVHLAFRSFFELSSLKNNGSNLPTLIWIGRNIQPHVPSLVHILDSIRRDVGAGAGAAHANGFCFESFLNRLIFVDPPNDATRLWLIDISLRCPNTIVIADARGLTMAGSRRLQLSAESGMGIGLLARPSRERGMISAARTRWDISRLRPVPDDARVENKAMNRSESVHPRWLVELFRFKGAASSFYESRHRWIMEVNRHDDHGLCAHPVARSSDVGDGPHQAQIS